MRQAYDYWQDQPDSYRIRTDITGPGEERLIKDGSPTDPTLHRQHRKRTCSTRGEEANFIGSSYNLRTHSSSRERGHARLGKSFRTDRMLSIRQLTTWQLAAASVPRRMKRFSLTGKCTTTVHYARPMEKKIAVRWVARRWSRFTGFQFRARRSPCSF